MAAAGNFFHILKLCTLFCFFFLKLANLPHSANFSKLVTSTTPSFGGVGGCYVVQTIKYLFYKMLFFIRLSLSEQNTEDYIKHVIPLRVGETACSWLLWRCHPHIKWDWREKCKCRLWQSCFLLWWSEQVMLLFGTRR